MTDRIERNKSSNLWIPIGSVITALGVVATAAAIWATDRAELHANTADVVEVREEIKENSKRISANTGRIHQQETAATAQRELILGLIKATEKAENNANERFRALKGDIEALRRLFLENRR